MAASVVTGSRIRIIAAIAEGSLDKEVELIAYAWAELLKRFIIKTLAEVEKPWTEYHEGLN